MSRRFEELEQYQLFMLRQYFTSAKVQVRNIGLSPHGIYLYLVTKYRCQYGANWWIIITYRPVFPFKNLILLPNCLCIQCLLYKPLFLFKTTSLLSETKPFLSDRT